MVAMNSSIEEATWAFLHINGTVYKGKGKVVGDLKLNVNKSTFSFKVAGGNLFQQ